MIDKDANIHTALEKLGSRAYGRKPNKFDETAMGAAGGAAGIAGTGLASVLYRATILPGFGKGTEHFSGRTRGLSNLAKAMKVKQKLRFVETGNAAKALYLDPKSRIHPQMAAALKAMGMAPHATKASIFGSKKSTIAAHELGHARIRDFTLGRLAGKLRLGMIPAAAVGTAAAVIADPDSKLSKLAPIIPGIPVAAVLADEAGATILGDKGLRRLKSLGGKPLSASKKKAILRGYRKAMLKSFGSYGIIGGGLVATPYLARKAKQWVRNQGKK